MIAKDVGCCGASVGVGPRVDTKIAGPISLCRSGCVKRIRGCTETFLRSWAAAVLLTVQHHITSRAGGGAPRGVHSGKEPCGRRRLRSQAWREGHLAHCQLCLEAWQNAKGEGVMETRSASAGADASARNGDRPAMPRQAGKIAPNCYEPLLKTIEWGWAPSPREAEYSA